MVLRCFFVLVFSLFTNLALAQSQKATISGLSSGAFMAVQMHVAHSQSLGGVAALAGGPYQCSGGQVSGALFSCMNTFLGLPKGKSLFDSARQLGVQGAIDKVSHMEDSKVVLVTGQNDATVAPVVVYENTEFYQQLNAVDIKVIDDLPVGHAFPTVDQGNPCETASQSPYVSACRRDVAGEILQHFYGDLKPPGKVQEDSFFKFDQPPGNSMDQLGVAYFPASCLSRDCKIHISLHGCQQGMSGAVGDFYFKNVGFNEWAESNDIIVIYPQAVTSTGNPNQCWDWWGYLKADYYTKEAPQIRAIKEILDAFSDKSIQLKSF